LSNRRQSLSTWTGEREGIQVELVTTRRLLLKEARDPLRCRKGFKR
jgi:hypothetical protein